MLIALKIGDTVINTYSIYWSHYRPIGTKCTVKTGDTIIATGSAVVSKKDRNKFCKEIGRKVSLTRAIHSFPKEVRTQIWQAYFKRGAYDIKNNIM